MKKILSFVMALLFPVFMIAQIIYYDATDLPLLGKATQHTVTRYERLPDSLEQITRRPIWELGKNTAGLALRFRTNSPVIAARWDVLYDNTMNHMTPTGIKGLDLYTYINNQWRFVNSARPQGKTNQAVIVSNMEPQEREYMLYLPLYDGVTSLYIGIDSLSVLSRPAIGIPTQDKPVVCYGTSILQGGCASRPGMAHTNILSRWFNREFINLGFSGNGQLDYEIAEIMAAVDASLYILDFVPNASIPQMREKAERFFEIIRSRRPEVPVIFIEDPVFTTSLFDKKMDNEVKSKNNTIREIYDLLVKQGEQQIYFVTSENMIGQDGEATVDGIHFTDVGFLRYSELLFPVIKELIE